MSTGLPAIEELVSGRVPGPAVDVSVYLPDAANVAVWGCMRFSACLPCLTLMKCGRYEKPAAEAARPPATFAAAPAAAAAAPAAAEAQYLQGTGTPAQQQPRQQEPLEWNAHARTSSSSSSSQPWGLSCRRMHGCSSSTRCSSSHRGPLPPLSSAAAATPTASAAATAAAVDGAAFLGVESSTASTLPLAAAAAGTTHKSNRHRNRSTRLPDGSGSSSERAAAAAAAYFATGADEDQASTPLAATPLAAPAGISSSRPRLVIRRNCPSAAASAGGGPLVAAAVAGSSAAAAEATSAAAAEQTEAADGSILRAATAAVAAAAADSAAVLRLLPFLVPYQTPVGQRQQGQEARSFGTHAWGEYLQEVRQRIAAAATATAATAAAGADLSKLQVRSQEIAGYLPPALGCCSVQCTCSCDRSGSSERQDCHVPLAAGVAAAAATVAAEEEAFALLHADVLDLKFHWWRAVAAAWRKKQLPLLQQQLSLLQQYDPQQQQQQQQRQQLQSYSAWIGCLNEATASFLPKAREHLQAAAAAVEAAATPTAAATQQQQQQQSGRSALWEWLWGAAEAFGFCCSSRFTALRLLDAYAAHPAFPFKCTCSSTETSSGEGCRCCSNRELALCAAAALLLAAALHCHWRDIATDQFLQQLLQQLQQQQIQQEQQQLFTQDDVIMVQADMLQLLQPCLWMSPTPADALLVHLAGLRDFPLLLQHTPHAAAVAAAAAAAADAEARGAAAAPAGTASMPPQNVEQQQHQRQQKQQPQQLCPQIGYSSSNKDGGGWTVLSLFDFFVGTGLLACLHDVLLRCCYDAAAHGLLQQVPGSKLIAVLLLLLLRPYAQQPQPAQRGELDLLRLGCTAFASSSNNCDGAIAEACASVRRRRRHMSRDFYQPRAELAQQPMQRQQPQSWQQKYARVDGGAADAHESTARHPSLATAAVGSSVTPSSARAQPEAVTGSGFWGVASAAASIKLLNVKQAFRGACIASRISS
ncbi:ice-structuring glycoprotein-like [Cyclospora cayetanensis]|uniref:Ice-structuring glycoprotein-like n=1 Tax=Cyclospora cayetanensis TaxID=88456 RepID=A0A6P6RQ59_9EIME|nr:ice-structuring glycoprotein-like [Cyclospora cayetanensis]